MNVISTHTLRKEGDLIPAGFNVAVNISTHTLRKEGDLHDADVNGDDSEFQPTPSARRVTLDKVNKTVRICHFNPHPPQGG